MGLISSEAEVIYRDFVVPADPLSGDHVPTKADIRGLFTTIDTAMTSVGIDGSISVAAATKAFLDSELNFDAGALALVFADATAANGIYIKSSTAGVGQWDETDFALPASFASDFADVIAGLADINAAIVAAEAAQSAAQSAQGEADIAATAAAASGSAAAAAQLAAEVALADAQLAATEAGAAQTASAGSETGAARSAANAETAKDGAEAAAVDAVAAKTAAETAQSLTEGFRDEASASATTAEGAKTDAELARDAAIDAAKAGPMIYETVNAGLAGTTDSQTFWVEGADGVSLYRNDLGVAVELMTLTPTTLYVPDQSNTPRSLALGSGLRSLENGGGQQGQDNITVGFGSGQNLTTGYNNILIGTDTGKSLAGVDTFTSYGAPLGNVGNVFVGPNIGSAANGALDNTGVGANVFQNLSKGMDNVAFGINALRQIVDGSENAAFGHAALEQLQGSGDYATGDGHRNTAVGDMAGRFLNGNTTFKTGGKSGVYVGTQTTGLSNTAVNENVFGAYAWGFGSNTVSLGSPDVTQQRHQGLVTVGLGAQVLAPAAPLHAYNLTSAGLESDGLRASAPGAAQVFGFLAVKANSTTTVVGATAVGERGQVWMRVADETGDELFPLKIDGAGEVYLPEAKASQAPANLQIDPATGCVSRSTGEWSAWTPTHTSEIGTITSVTVNTARYSYLTPTTVSFTLDVTISDGGTGSGSYQPSLPVPAAHPTALSGFDQLTTGLDLVVRVRPANLSKMNIVTNAGATAIQTGRRLIMAGTYHAA